MIKIDYDNLKISNSKLNKSNDSIKINITGDWAPSLGGISKTLIEKQDSYYGELSKYFSNGDFNIINLETVIDTQKRDFEKSSVRLVDKPEVLTSLNSINIHLACLANNHIMDNGVDGLKQTINYLKEYKISYLGAGLLKEEIYKPYLFEKNGQKIAIINTAEGEEANEKYNNHIGSSDIESYKIIDQIRECKKQGYFTILIAHAGVEFIPTPPPHIQELYRTFIDEGVGLVVGHHPHVSQGFEIYKDAFIFYSLGNFGIYRKNSRKMEQIGYILNIEFTNNDIGCINIVPYQIGLREINSLCGTKLEDFKKSIQKSSEIIQNCILLQRVWIEYITLRYPVLELKNIIDYFKLDYSFSKMIQKNLVTQYSRRFMFFPIQDVKEFKFLDYLNEYGCIKKINLKDKIFFLQKNLLYFIYKRYTSIYNLLKKIKRALFK